MLSEFQPKLSTSAARRHLCSHALVTNALRLLWVVFIIGGELGIFFWSLSGCRWPSIYSGQKSGQKLKATHVLLLADTQVQHSTLEKKRSWWAHRILFELNLRKSWHVTSRLKPDAVIFLGDMLANGKSAQSLEEYKQAAQKFKSIFSVDRSVPVHYVVGNNDVGLGLAPSVTKKVRSYYLQSFGPVNKNFEIANHTFIGLDAPGIVDEDYQRHGKYITFDNWKPITGGPVSFVNQMAEYESQHAILLSHIPLSRSETAYCGPLREKGTIRRGAGPGYQSMLGKQTTNFLLKNLQPVAIFSADNRDYCEYVHVGPGDSADTTNPHGPIREVTVKSFSMSVHIRQPGFQLLSLVDPAKLASSDLKSFADTPCLLPDQYRIYTSFYAPCIFLTFLILVALNFSRARFRTLRKPENLSLTPPTRSSSGRASPNPMVNPDSAMWTATWSPYAPALSVSPPGTLPSYIRTPHTPAGITRMLEASQPGTPNPASPSSLVVPMSYSDRDEDEEDTLYPTQYAARRDIHMQREDDDWSYAGRSKEDEDYEMITDQEAGRGNSLGRQIHSEFITAPDHARQPSSLRRQKWSWSYTFTFKGRARRITLRLPSWTSVYNFFDLFGLSGSDSMGISPRRRRDRWMSVILDALSVLWPAVIVWVIINWTIL
ncbi:hypothetical protein BYT27DRAFT_7191027 [Phlegmacium glaucopus]|nr:hypothetical protein BYT27DRAFT_7191027 [Phlegmacium glaucopus]